MKAQALSLSTLGLFLLSLTSACGPAQTGDGFTACGAQVCQPGQYCVSPQLGVCENGCTSDANCQPGHACVDIDEVLGQGVCSETEVKEPQDPNPDPPPSDPLAACQAACDSFQGCGLPAGEAAQCRSDCTGLTADQQTAIGNCEDETCGQKLSCLGVDCFSDSDCAAGEQCLDYTCL